MVAVIAMADNAQIAGWSHRYVDGLDPGRLPIGPSGEYLPPPLPVKGREDRKVGSALLAVQPVDADGANLPRYAEVQLQPCAIFLGGPVGAGIAVDASCSEPDFSEWLAVACRMNACPAGNVSTTTTPLATSQRQGRRNASERVSSPTNRRPSTSSAG